MMQLIECIPNISEGCNKGLINLFSEAIINTPGVELLNTDGGCSANRTVFTIIGEPNGIFEAAEKLYHLAASNINMATHSGQHPCIGAIDVCPFVPVKGIDFETLQPLVEQFANKMASNLNIPVYLYEKSARDKKRTNLAAIRKGGYAKLHEKLKNQQWQPDAGKSIFNPKFGATVIGVRDYLLAFNVNLITNNISKAKKIAEKLRESGTSKYGNGLLKGVKAIAWKIDDFNTIQVSTNITDYKQNGLYEVYSNIAQLANELSIKTGGSELIGMLPLDAIVSAAHRYINAQQITGDKIQNNDIVEMFISYLGLNSVKPFQKENNIIEYKSRFFT